MRFVIAGLSNTGKYLADLLFKEGHEVVAIDSNEDRCTEMAGSSDVIVINGDATKTSVLEQAGVKDAEALMALTNDDSDNLMISMIAKEMGVKKVIAVVNDESHAEAFKEIGVRFQVKPSAVLAKHIERMISQPYVKDFLTFERAELFEIEVEEGMKCVGKKISEMGILNGVKILFVGRGEKYLDESAEIEPEDWLTIIINRQSSKKGIEFMNRWFAKG